MSHLLEHTAAVVTDTAGRQSRTPEQLEKTVVEPAQDEDAATRPSEEELVVEDLLVEDVSIDGMCGVY